MSVSSPSFVALLVELARNVTWSEREQEKAKEWGGGLERVFAGERRIWRERGRERDRESMRTCARDNWCVCKRDKMRERKDSARERGVDMYV
mmetsp:Transcript_13647/g.21625  ORF Transcript_13647/g.21625 Transcript_13647/m.21625 type:complete len:92 (-) Transcript_13647:96-371(-)